MRGLRVQSSSKPLRVFHAFDPLRVAILLIGGDKTGDESFYDRMITLVDALYNDYLANWYRRKTMGGRHSFAELRARMTPAEQAEAQRLGEQMGIAEVRCPLKLSQDEIAAPRKSGRVRSTGTSNASTCTSRASRIVL